MFDAKSTAQSEVVLSGVKINEQEITWGKKKQNRSLWFV